MCQSNELKVTQDNNKAMVAKLFPFRVPKFVSFFSVPHDMKKGSMLLGGHAVSYNALHATHCSGLVESIVILSIHS